MNINFSNVILVHAPVEEVLLCKVKSNAISATSTTFRFQDVDQTTILHHMVYPNYAPFKHIRLDQGRY